MALVVLGTTLGVMLTAVLIVYTVVSEKVKEMRFMGGNIKDSIVDTMVELLDRLI